MRTDEWWEVQVEFYYAPHRSRNVLLKARLKARPS
jgi:hypothetical protein